MSGVPSNKLSRRGFSASLVAAASAVTATPQQTTPAVPQQAPPAQQPVAVPEDTSLPERKRLKPDPPPFGQTIEFTRRELSSKVQTFALTEVRLLDGPFKRAQEANLAYLRRLDTGRLTHNFRVNAGLSSTAEPLGGWEKPDCELRGHFTGHYLSACALMYSATGDNDIKAKGDAIVDELAKCQQKLPAGYLSAFPLEYFDRLDARQKVWAPFYTIHKIMAGMFDMAEYCGNRQAMQVLERMSAWADKWTASKPEPHMQDILNTEYGGMNEVLYNLAATSGDENWATVGDRFTKKRFFNPLALRRDELRGLHVNTHIPQVIGAARRYEISSDNRFHDVADFFWYEVTSARAYVTGGTSNDEGWLVEPRRLGAELKKAANSTECCCAYNMLKLTTHLYRWTADPRYFDYYERTLYNHRLAAIEPLTGHTQYYLSIVPGAWKTFNTDNDSFWCCTGTGVEEFSKLAGNIYAQDGRSLYVNLFIPSELKWKDRGLTVRQETAFPEGQTITLTFSAAAPVETPLQVRIPWWADSGISVKLNGRALEAAASPGSYLTLRRTWNSGDRIELTFPMSLHIEAMPDEPNTQAVLFGPLVLAGDLGTEGLTPDLITGPMGPEVDKHPLHVPSLHAAGSDPAAWIRPADRPLTFRASGQSSDITFVPLDRIFNRRYSVYWNVT